LRDGKILNVVGPYTAARFERAIIMPNLDAPDHITTIAQANMYRKRILAATKGYRFEPLMTAYLTDDINVEELVWGFTERIFTAAKLYPVGATTNSQCGVTSFNKLQHILKAMEKAGMPLCYHGETVAWKGKEIPFREREHVFLNEELPQHFKNFPGLRIIFEHVSTAEGVRIVKAQDPRRVGATVTAHHPWMNEIDVLRGGMSTDLHCLPVLKSEEDRLAVRAAMVADDNEHFFLGTDSAPHLLQSKKRVHRAAGGIFTDHAGIELYTHMFEAENKLHNLERFASLLGNRFYGFAPSKDLITLEKSHWTVDELIHVNHELDDDIWPFLYEMDPTQRQPINWRMVNDYR
jgi:dihydroorotase